MATEPPQGGESSAKRALKRRFVAQLSAAALVCVVVFSAGLLYSESRNSALQRYMDERVPTVAIGAEQLLESMRLSAQLAATLNSASPLPRVPVYKVWMLQAVPGGYSIIRNPVRPDEPVEREGELFAFPRSEPTNGEGYALLWPPKDTQVFAYCARARPPIIACSIITLQGLVEYAKQSTSFIELALTAEAGRVVARTSGWETVGDDLSAGGTMSAGNVRLGLLGRPGAALRRTFGFPVSNVGAMAAALFVAVSTLLFVRYRAAVRQLALMGALERTRAEGDVLVRETLSATANAAGVLVWLLRDDASVELLGPWERDLSVTDKRLTLERALRSVRDGQSVHNSLLDALRERKPWSRVLVVDSEGDELTYQSNSSPIFDSAGRFRAMLGVSLNITQALKTQTQVMRDEAYRAVQTDYLRLMTKEVSGPAMHVQAVVDLLSRQFGSQLNAEQGRLLSLASAEARRLADVVRGSLELMNLRGMAVAAELVPQPLDALVSEVAAAVEKREANARGQRFDIAVESHDNALVHRSSLLTMVSSLLSNASRFSPPNSTVLIRVWKSSTAMHVSIEDEGPGMTQDEITRVGEPFFRGMSSIRVPGSGLGVAMAFELANYTRSSIRFDRSPDGKKGLLVTLSFPSAQ